MAAILNFGGHFGSNINNYKSEIFLMLNKTFVDMSMDKIARHCFLYIFKKSFLNKITFFRCHVATTIEIKTTIEIIISIVVENEFHT